MRRNHDIIYDLQEKASLHGLIAFVLEVILAELRRRAMSNGKKISKKMLSKEDIKLVVLMVATVAIAVGIPHLLYYSLSYNNIFMVFLGLWLTVLDFNLLMVQFIYIMKDGLRSPNPKKRLYAIRVMKAFVAVAYIVTAIGIYGGSRILASYFVYLRALASGLTKAPVIMTPQEVISALLLLISLPLPAYVVTREGEKAIRLGVKNITSA